MFGNQERDQQGMEVDGFVAERKVICDETSVDGANA
jgi:hypothetical protein